MDKEGPDQTARMRSLIRAFVVRICYIDHTQFDQSRHNDFFFHVVPQYALFNDTLTHVGHFVPSVRFREKRGRSAST